MTTLRILIDGKERLNEEATDVEWAVNLIRQYIAGDGTPECPPIEGRIALISETDNVTRLWPLKAA
jgi:hypothetical protein